MDTFEIRTKQLSKIYSSDAGETVALDATDLNIRKGEFVCFLGPSGCGKTTLLRMLGGLLPPTEGEILVGEHPLWSGGRLNKRAQGDLGFVFQQANLFPWRTVSKNVDLPLQLRRADRHTRQARIDELLELVGLGGFAKAMPHELSGGMQQRVAIARALSHDPDILLMDEPFGALDAMTREQMNLELQRLWLETGRTILLVTHSISEAVFLGDRIVSLSRRPGRVARITEVPFERPRPIELQRETTFQDMVLELRELLQGDGPHA